MAEGESFGLVGPPGSGKTTAVRILATLLRPDSGRATVSGFSVVTEAAQVRRITGYLPQRIGVYPRQAAREMLEFSAGMHRVASARRGPLSLELLEVVGLADRADDQVTTLDVGELRRLGLAACLVHDPAVLLLDSPLAGLDAVSSEEVRTLLSELSGMGKTILATARRQEDLAGVCTRTQSLLPAPADLAEA